VVPNADVNQVVRYPQSAVLLSISRILSISSVGRPLVMRPRVMRSGSGPGIGKRILEEEGRVCLRAEAVCWLEGDTKDKGSVLQQVATACHRELGKMKTLSD